MPIFVLICRKFYADQKFQKGSFWENGVQNDPIWNFYEFRRSNLKILGSYSHS